MPETIDVFLKNLIINFYLLKIINFYKWRIDNYPIGKKKYFVLKK